MIRWPRSLLLTLLLLGVSVRASAQVVRADGDPAAQTRHGLALISGDGVHKDVTAGLDLLRKAAEKAHPPALRVLGDVFAAGNLVRRDEAFAVALYRAAADRGDGEAQWQLAERYDQGRGVARDGDAAMRWRFKALSNGHPAAAVWLVALICARLVF